MSTIESPASPFETEHYLAINEARWSLVECVLADLRGASARLSTAYDLGAGPGWFADRLTGSGLDVVGLEGREDVAAAARRAAPEARIEVMDLDAMGMDALPPPRDFVLAFGILYHLENPLRTLRIAKALTGGVMLLETMTLPDPLPVARVIRENRNQTQGMRDLALLLSPSAIEWGLWAAGFKHVQRHSGQLTHPDFLDTPETHRRRHIWLASETDVRVRDFEPVEMKEPRRANFWRRD